MDPRSVGPQQRVSNHSPLMRALSRKQTGEIPNFCPFGCPEAELDESGYCGHLIGFYNGGASFEPRCLRKKDGRIIVTGENRAPMKKGYKLVKITTSARVYAPEINKDLVPKRNAGAGVLSEIMQQERELQEFAERIRNPVLDGAWDDSVYNPTPLAAAAKPESPPRT